MLPGCGGYDDGGSTSRASGRHTFDAAADHYNQLDHHCHREASYHRHGTLTSGRARAVVASCCGGGPLPSGDDGCRGLRRAPPRALLGPAPDEKAAIRQDTSAHHGVRGRLEVSHVHQCRVTKAVDGRVGERTMTRTCARGSEGELLQQQHHTPALSVVEDPAQLHLHTRRERERCGSTGGRASLRL